MNTMKKILDQVVDLFKNTQADEGTPVPPESRHYPVLENGGTSQGPLPRIKQIAAALKQAAEFFDYDKVRPLKEWGIKKQFRVDQILTICNPEAMAFLEDVTRLDRNMRQSVVIANLANLGFDFSQFADWRIVASDGTDASATPIQGGSYDVLAGDGNFRVKLHFQFFGEFQDIPEGVTPPPPPPPPKPIAPTSTATSTPTPPQELAPRRGGVPETLINDPPAPRVNVGKACGTFINEETRLPIVRLRMKTLDGTEQSVDIFQLPFYIGREPKEGLSDVLVTPQSDKSSVSREHLVFTKFQAGAMLVSNLATQKNGTWYKGECLAETFLITPVSTNSTDGWYILGDRRPTMNSVAIRLESVLPNKG